MKSKLRQIREVKLVTAAKIMRTAWLDEQLDAQALGDEERAIHAATLVKECDRRIAQLRAVPAGVLRRLGAQISSLLH